MDWELKFLDTQTLVDIYNREFDENLNFLYGVTLYPNSLILVNKDMEKQQQLHTLKHELTHCYIWQTGLYHVEKFDNEMVCDLVASSNNFINEIVEKVKRSWE